MRKTQHAIFFLTPGILMRFLAKKCENIAKSRQKMIPVSHLENRNMGIPYPYLDPWTFNIFYHKFSRRNKTLPTILPESTALCNKAVSCKCLHKKLSDSEKTGVIWAMFLVIGKQWKHGQVFVEHSQIRSFVHIFNNINTLILEFRI